MPAYAEIVQPLITMTRKGEPHKLRWTIERESAFEPLKVAVSSRPVLRVPDPTKQFILKTDASETGMEVVLMREHDGLLHPIAYASKQFLPHEQKYSTIQRQCFFFLWAVQKFHFFLFGKLFMVQTDHHPLQYLN